MTATEGYIQGPVDSTGKKVDTTTVTQTNLDGTGGVTVHREVSTLGDPENLNARARIRNNEALAVADAEAKELLRVIHEDLQELLFVARGIASHIG